MKHSFNLMIIFIVMSHVLLGCQQDIPAATDTYSPVPLEGEETVEEIPFSVFTPQEEPFDYQYKIHKNGKAEMQLPYPSHWNLKTYSDRHIMIASPSDDYYLDNVTIHIVTDYDTLYESSSAQNSMYLFESTLPTLPIIIDGKHYTKLPYDYPEVVSSKEYIIENSPDILSYTLDENLNTIKNGFELNKNGPIMTNLCYYVNWPLRPTLVFVAGQTDQLERLTALSDYIVSHISQYVEEDSLAKSTLIKSLFGEFKTEFYLPGTWIESTPTVISPFNHATRYTVQDTNSVFAGMTATIYTLDAEKYPVIDEKLIEDQFIDRMFPNMVLESVRQSDFNNSCYVEYIDGGELAGKEGSAYQVRINIRKYNQNVAPSLVDGSFINSFVFVLRDDKEINMIAISFQEIQERHTLDMIDLFGSTLSTSVAN